MLQQQQKQQPIFSVPLPSAKSKQSYTGYAKSAVLSQWQKCLQKQQYEEACHWTVEMDASGWQADLWQKLIVYASKYVHVHCPKLPLLMARNYAYYQLHCIKHAQVLHKPPHQLRNQAQLQQNLCQLIGLVSLSAKGPVYTLPQIDVSNVNDSELVCGTHAWLMPHKSDADNKIVLRMLSTLFCHVESKCVHKMVYWLSVLVEYDKHQKKNKAPITMAGRKPLLPDDKSYRHVYLEGGNATDWVWLLWRGLAQGAMAFGKSIDCIRTLKALGYLYALDYTTSKRNTRMPLLLHALHLVCTDVDWTSSVYHSVNDELIAKACTNVGVMYEDIVQRRAILVASAALNASSPTNYHPSSTNDTNANAEAHTNVHQPATIATIPSVDVKNTQNTLHIHQPNKGNKATAKSNNMSMSIDSNQKFNVFSKIDASFLGL